MAEAEKKKKEDGKKEQLRDSEGNLMYRVLYACMFRNEFFAHGQIVSFPEDVKVEHDCIIPMYEEAPKTEEVKVAVYYPNKEYLSRIRIESARAGIIGA